jgi:hypothetical protein
MPAQPHAAAVVLRPWVSACGVLTLVLLPAAGAEREIAARRPADVAAQIDRAIERYLTEKGIRASPQADDADFVRRVTLDLIGRVPTAAEAAAFLDDRAADKRARLIDALRVFSASVHESS